MYITGVCSNAHGKLQQRVLSKGWQTGSLVGSTFSKRRAIAEAKSRRAGSVEGEGRDARRAVQGGKWRRRLRGKEKSRRAESSVAVEPAF